MIFEELKYIYKGTSDYNSEKSFFQNDLEAELIWEFERFGTKVCAIKLGNANHSILIANHLESYKQIHIYRTDNLTESIEKLKKNGVELSSEPFGIPDGQCVLFKDVSGKEYGVYQKTKDDDYLKNEYLRQQSEIK
ncbi:VOC family protein [Nonlabens sp. SY33080]|uniref:VOC family protein n=1 Tax=Nonlabens sp. SY33080 TaxID=2719911 RepID=UPI001428C7E5|nr:hypothetical protein [Nonlabens sp. SY33080]